MKIFKWDRWTDIKEDRVEPIGLNMFKKFLKENCYSDKYLMKKIYEPDFSIGIYKKSKKIGERYYPGAKTFESNSKWKSYPLRENSLVCYNYEENSEGITFLVFPFKNSLFTISPVKESCYIQDISRYNKGYWADKLKWMENLNDREMWTESNCLVIEKSIYDKLFEYSDYNNTDYNNSTSNILATTLIGEAGGKMEEMKKVMNVLNNRAKKRNTTPQKEALRSYQFSMWNSIYDKIKINGKTRFKFKGIEHIKNVIKTHKSSSHWGKKHWDLAYKIIKQNDISPIPDTTKGATFYYALKLEPNKKPYWTKLDKWKETIRTIYHAYGKL